jgi:hypothetical protein
MRAFWYRSFRRVVALPRRRRFALLMTAVLLVGATGLLLSSALNSPGQTSLPAAPALDGRWTLAEMQDQVEAGRVTSIDAAANDAGLILLVAHTADAAYAINPGVPARDTAAAVRNLGYADLLDGRALGIAVGASAAESGDPLRSMVSIGFIVVLVVVAMLLVVQMRSAGIGPFGRSSARFSTIMPALPSVTGARTTAPSTTTAAHSPGSGDVLLADVAGCDEAKLELAEAIEFLRDPAHFRKLGARVPRGILLYGPPGTGKTMLARAVATEAGVPFHHASGSDFVEKYVGVGARRVRDLFEQARKLGSGVIFIDEFDALGKARGGTNSHEEREQTLNQLLVELDGFGTAENLVVIAATNRLDVLDEAVLRPGRFSRKVHVGPARRGRPAGNPRGPRPWQAARRGRFARAGGTQDLRLLRRPAGRPAQRGGDPGRAAARRSAEQRGHPRRLAQGCRGDRPAALDERTRAGDHRRPRGRPCDLWPRPRR